MNAQLIYGFPLSNLGDLTLVKKGFTARCPMSGKKIIGEGAWRTHRQWVFTLRARWGHTAGSPGTVLRLADNLPSGRGYPSKIGCGILTHRLLRQDPNVEKFDVPWIHVLTQGEEAAQGIIGLKLSLQQGLVEGVTSTSWVPDSMASRLDAVNSVFNTLHGDRRLPREAQPGFHILENF